MSYNKTYNADADLTQAAVLAKKTPEEPSIRGDSVRKISRSFIQAQMLIY